MILPPPWPWSPSPPPPIPHHIGNPDGCAHATVKGPIHLVGEGRAGYVGHPNKRFCRCTGDGSMTIENLGCVNYARTIELAMPDGADSVQIRDCWFDSCRHAIWGGRPKNLSHIGLIELDLISVKNSRGFAVWIASPYRHCVVKDPYISGADVSALVLGANPAGLAPDYLYQNVTITVV